MHRTGAQIADLQARLPGYSFLYQHAMIEFPLGLSTFLFVLHLLTLSVSGHHTEEGVALLFRHPLISHDALHLTRNFTDGEVIVSL